MPGSKILKIVNKVYSGDFNRLPDLVIIARLETSIFLNITKVPLNIHPPLKTFGGESEGQALVESIEE